MGENGKTVRYIRVIDAYDSCKVLGTKLCESRSTLDTV